MANVGRLVKESFLKELSDQVGPGSDFFITSIGRLGAPDADELRKKLHASHSRMLVVPRRLGMRFIKPLQIDAL